MNSIQVGQKFGRWTVLAEAPMRTHNHRYWVCECDCPAHKRKEVGHYNLLYGRSVSCGCVLAQKRHDRRLIEEVRFKQHGFLVPIAPVENIGKRTRWMCVCTRCGNMKAVDTNALRQGLTVSCTCYRKEVSSLLNRTHGMTGTAEYRVWTNMKTRCFNPKASGYERYGERGITVCDRWRNNFEAFYEDMGKRPEGYSIDRINVDGNYCPENCKWATAAEQARNRSNNHWVSYQDEWMVQTDFAAVVRMTTSQVSRLLQQGKTPEEIAMMSGQHNCHDMIEWGFATPATRDHFEQVVI